MASGPVSRATYWRRRVFLLVGLLLVLTLIAFACRPSGDEDEATNTSSTDSSAESEATPDSGEPTDPSIPASPSADAGAADEDGAEDGEGGGGDATGGSSGPGGGSNAAAGSGGGGGGGQGAAQPAADACRPEDVVVTLIGEKTDYSGDAKPKFTLTTVNTGDRPCTADVGPAALELLITSGDDRIWSSADCVEGQAADLEELRRGVPHITVVTWDRTRSWSDCRDEVVNARPGTYVATLHSDYEGSGEQQVFRLN